MNTPVLEVSDLAVHFPVRGRGLIPRSRSLKAVNGVSFAVEAGETLGVVGESGCGKSTLARAILRLVPLAAGSVRLLGEDLAGLDGKAMRQRRKSMQIVFQDPLASLNPRMPVGGIVGEPLETFEPALSKGQRIERVHRILAEVGMDAGHIDRFPHEFSGGQCQRIGIARALILQPPLLLCDEPVSALDVSVQAQIVNLLTDLQARMGLALLFISHDLSVVRHISHRVLVMYLGKVVEIADRDTLYSDPRHPYTRALIDAVPVPDPARERARVRRTLVGDLPSPLDPPTGCAFRTRCPRATGLCAAQTPALARHGSSLVACHHAG